MTRRRPLIVQQEKLLRSAVSDYIDRIVDGCGLRQRVITQPRPKRDVEPPIFPCAVPYTLYQSTPIAWVLGVFLAIVMLAAVEYDIRSSKSARRQSIALMTRREKGPR